MSAEITTVAPGVVRVSWSNELQEQGLRVSAEEVRRVVESAFKGGSTRVETHVDPDDEAAQRVATFAGLMREGVARGVAEESDRIVYARLADDTPLEDPKGFRSLLNSFLPRKRAISQLLVRSTDGRVLLCQLTYKRDFDLPGGVVEVSESPQLAVAREVEEELGLTVEAGPLLLTDWLPPVGWLGRRDLPRLRRRRARPLGRGRHRPPGARDPLRRLLHDRRGPREVRRLHRPANRVSPPQPVAPTHPARRTPKAAAASPEGWRSSDGGPQPQVVEQRAKRADRRDQRAVRRQAAAANHRWLRSERQRASRNHSWAYRVDEVEGVVAVRCGRRSVPDAVSRFGSLTRPLWLRFRAGRNSYPHLEHPIETVSPAT